MGDRRCCCGECWDWQDFFTDPHDDAEAPCRSDLEYWQVVSPIQTPSTWEIAFYDPFCTLTESGTAGATILCTELIPNGPSNDEDTLSSRYGKIIVSIHDDEVGDTYSILLDWFWLDRGGEGSSSSSSGSETNLQANYLEFRYYRSNENLVVLSLYSYIDGVETLLETCDIIPTDPSGTGLYMEACISRSSFYGTASGGTVVGPIVNTRDPDVTDLGFYFGLRHNNAHNAIFSDWYMYQLIDDHPDCPFCGVCQCGFWCEGPIYPVPHRLLLTYIGYDDGCEFCSDCSGLTGESVILEGAECEYDLNQTIKDYIWRGTFGEDSPCFSPYLGIPKTMTLYCGPMPRDVDICNPCDPLQPCDPPDNNPAWGWLLGTTDVGPGLLYERNCVQKEEDHLGNEYVDYSLHSLVESTCNPFMLVFEVDFLYPAFDEEHPELYPFNCGVDGSVCNPCGHDAGDPLTDWYRVHYKIVITQAPVEEVE